MLESYEDTTTYYFLMGYDDDNGLYPNIFPIIILQFKNDNPTYTLQNLHCFHTFTLVLHTLMLTRSSSIDQSI